MAANLKLRRYLDDDHSNETNLDFVFKEFQQSSEIEALFVTQLKAQFIGNIKSFCVLQFRKILETWCNHLLKQNANSKHLNVAFREKIARALSIELAGKTGAGFDSEEYDSLFDQDNDSKKDFTFAEYLKVLLQSWTLKQDELNFVELISSLDRVNTYLPSSLNHPRATWTAIPTGKKKPMGWKSWVNNDENVSLGIF